MTPPTLAAGHRGTALHAARRFGWLGALCLLVGCPAGDDTNDDYPTSPGGRPPVAGGGGDDGGDSLPGDGDGAGADAAEAIIGRVCVFAPLRAAFQGPCEDAGVDAQVEIDGRVARTLPNGNFAIALDSPIDPAAVFRVTGEDLVPTVMLPSEGNQLLAIPASAYADDLTLYGQLAPASEQGVILIQVVDGGLPVQRAEVTSDRQMDVGTLYDSATTPLFEPTILTGADGLAWIPTTEAGENPVRVRMEGSVEAVTVVLPVESQAITFHRLELP